MRWPEIIDGVRIKQITDNPDNVVNFRPQDLAECTTCWKAADCVKWPRRFVQDHCHNYENQLLKLVCVVLKTNYTNETMNHHLP